MLLRRCEHYERDLQKQTSEQRLNKDEYLTVDPCKNDLFPIVGWAQLHNRGIFKLKADLPNLKPQPRGSRSRAEEPTSELPSCSSEPTSPSSSPEPTFKFATAKRHCGSSGKPPCRCSLPGPYFSSFLHAVRAAATPEPGPGLFVTQIASV